MIRIAWAVLWLTVTGVSPVLAEQLFDTEAATEHFNAGLDLYFSHNYKDAIREFETAAEIDPDNANAYYFMGYSYYKLKDMTKAREVFDQAYETDSKYSPIHNASTGEVPPDQMP